VKNEEQEVRSDSSGYERLGKVRVDADNRRLGRSQRVGSRRKLLLDGGGTIGRAVGLAALLIGSSGHHVCVQDLRECDGGCHANNGSKGKHQTDHDTREVTGEDCVYDNEDLLVLELAEAHVHTSREEPDEHVEIEEVRGPSSGLVLGDGGNDGNVNLGVSSVPQGVEAASPGCDGSRDGKQDQSSKCPTEHNQDHCAKESLELLGGELVANPFGETNELQQTEDACEC
jgi:hypothetical protein